MCSDGSYDCKLSSADLGTTGNLDAPLQPAFVEKSGCNDLKPGISAIDFLNAIVRAANEFNIDLFRSKRFTEKKKVKAVWFDQLGEYCVFVVRVWRKRDGKENQLFVEVQRRSGDVIVFSDILRKLRNFLKDYIDIQCVKAEEQEVSNRKECKSESLPASLFNITLSQDTITQLVGMLPHGDLLACDAMRVLANACDSSSDLLESDAIEINKENLTYLLGNPDLFVRLIEEGVNNALNQRFAPIAWHALRLLNAIAQGDPGIVDLLRFVQVAKTIVDRKDGITFCEDRNGCAVDRGIAELPVLEGGVRYVFQPRICKEARKFLQIMQIVTSRERERKNMSNL